MNAARNALGGPTGQRQETPLCVSVVDPAGHIADRQAAASTPQVGANRRPFRLLEFRVAPAPAVDVLSAAGVVHAQSEHTLEIEPRDAGRRPPDEEVL